MIITFLILSALVEISKVILYNIDSPFGFISLAQEMKEGAPQLSGWFRLLRTGLEIDRDIVSLVRPWSYQSGVLPSFPCHIDSWIRGDIFLIRDVNYYIIICFKSVNRNENSTNLQKKAWDTCTEKSLNEIQRDIFGCFF